MKQFTNKPIFIKVKGHSNVIRNDQADELAKSAAELTDKPYVINNYTETLYLFRKNIITNGYPNHALTVTKQVITGYQRIS